MMAANSDWSGGRELPVDRMNEEIDQLGVVGDLGAERPPPGVAGPYEVLQPDRRGRQLGAQKEVAVEDPDLGEVPPGRVPCRLLSTHATASDARGASLSLDCEAVKPA